VIDDPLIQRKQEQRASLLRALYGYVDGKEGWSISPQQWLALAERVGIPKEEISEVIRYMLSARLLVNKPASQAVALTHEGIVTVEKDHEQRTHDRSKKLEALPGKITAVLQSTQDTLQLMQLRAALPDYKELPDEDWFEVLKNLKSKGIVTFEVAGSSVGQSVSTAYRFGFANRSGIHLSDATNSNVGTPGSMRNAAIDNSLDVFVVHGHDQAMQQEVARFLVKLKLNPIILGE
jgi:hypothetical protein